MLHWGWMWSKGAKKRISMKIRGLTGISVFVMIITMIVAEKWRVVCIFHAR